MRQAGTLNYERRGRYTYGYVYIYIHIHMYWYYTFTYAYEPIVCAANSTMALVGIGMYIMTHTPTYMYTLWIMPWAHGAQYRIHLHTYCIPYCTVLYCDAYLYFTAIKLYRIPMLLSHCAVHLYCVAHVVIRTVLYRTVYYTVLHRWEDMPCMTVIRKCDVGLGGCSLRGDLIRDLDVIDANTIMPQPPLWNRWQCCHMKAWI